ncbi:TPA: terminase family protein [Vibrio parahaemolyticus]
MLNFFSKKNSVRAEHIMANTYKISEMNSLIEDGILASSDLDVFKPATEELLSYKELMLLNMPRYNSFSEDSSNIWYKNKASDRFSGKENFKNNNSRVHYTSEMRKEYARCKACPLYFAKNYVNITTIDDGVVKFFPRYYQEQFIYELHNNRNFIALQSRQTGKTTCAAIYITWLMIFHNYKQIGITGKTMAGAQEVLERVSLVIEYLPEFLSPGISSMNSESIEFENGSKVVALPANNKVRGRSFALIYCDEFAFVDNVETFFRKVVKPVTSAGKKSKIVLTSTPNGYNVFAELYENAVKGTNSFKAFTVNWRCIHERLYHQGIFDDGVNWKRHEIGDIGRVAFYVEHENDFTNSVSTLIDADTLDKLVPLNPISIEKSNNSYMASYKDLCDVNHLAVVVDPSSGCGGDYTCFTFVDVDEMRIAAVAKANNYTAVESTEFLMNVLNENENAYIIIELNDVRGVGRDIANRISQEAEYMHRHEDNQGKITNNLGLILDKHNKANGAMYLKQYIEGKQLEVSDDEIIKELFRFVNNNGKWQATQGFHDDMVMTLLGFCLINETSQRFAQWKETEFEEYDEYLAFRSGGWCDNESELQKSRNAHYAQYGNENWGSMSSGSEVWWR